MSVTAQQAQHFREHGYLAVPEFFSPGETAAIRAEVERLKPAEVPTDEVCSQGHPMVIKEGRFGRFLACTNYPEHKETRPLPEELPPGAPEEHCSHGVLMQLRTGRYGPFYTSTHECGETKPFAQRIGVLCPQDGGQVLEPGCGSGNFIGFAPGGARVTGVELDPVTASIAATLYPDADIANESFPGTRAPEGSLDLAIGNVPFGNYPVYDPAHNAARHSIHNYFIMKSLALTAPGGYVAAEKAIENAGGNEALKLRQNMRFLYSLGSVATLLGLIGTIAGMIKAFQVASVMGAGHADKLSEGIYEAMVNTFAGLAVAIVVTVFYYLFIGRIEKLVAEMNDAVNEFGRDVGFDASPDTEVAATATL